MKKRSRKSSSKRRMRTAAANRSLSADEVKAVLDSVHRVLRNRNVGQSIRLNFTAAEPALCWKRVCETLPDGTVRCHWVQEPC